MKKSLKRRILILILTFVVLLSALSVFMSYQNFVATMEQSSYSTASMVAETCALIINGDELETYTKSGKRDNRYYEIWNKLIDYRNLNDEIVKLSLEWFDEEGGHYIFDTDLTEKGAFLGDIEVFDSQQSQRKEELIRGSNIGYITYADQIVVYCPVSTSYNIPMGYVIVGISTLEAKREQNQYLLKLMIMVTALSLVLGIYFIWRIHRTIIRPINQLSEAAANYKEVVSENGKDSSLAHLEIHTGDEIENLFHSIRKMESDIRHSANNLAVATWNSHHDSMTQLFNKRYLEECIRGYEAEDSLGIIYFDVDNLKKMNDICGHESGDEVIKKTAEFIRRYQIEGSAGYRMGGDEFMLVVVGKTAEEMEEMVRTMKSDPQTTLTPPEKEVQCRIAIGYAYKEGEIYLEDLMKLADQNMYLDKQSHR